jgi:hypothetical protein
LRPRRGRGGLICKRRRWGYHGCSLAPAEPTAPTQSRETYTPTCKLERSDVIRRPISESAPTSCIGTCEATGAEVLRHLLVESAVSGRLALPEFTTTCALSGKRVLSDEVEPSSVTGKLAASAPNRSTLAAASSSRRIPGNAGVAQERPGLNVSGGANSRSLSSQLRYMRSSVPRLTAPDLLRKKSRSTVSSPSFS